MSKMRCPYSFEMVSLAVRNEDKTKNAMIFVKKSDIFPTKFSDKMEIHYPKILNYENKCVTLHTEQKNIS